MIRVRAELWGGQEDGKHVVVGEGVHYFKIPVVTEVTTVPLEDGPARSRPRSRASRMRTLARCARGCASSGGRHQTWE